MVRMVYRVLLTSHSQQSNTLLFCSYMYFLQSKIIIFHAIIFLLNLYSIHFFYILLYNKTNTYKL